MKLARSPIVAFLLLFGMLVIELIAYGGYMAIKRLSLNGSYQNRFQIEQLEVEKKRKALFDELEQAKYVATGKDAYERIYNAKQKDLPVLIETLALESVPPNYQVKVEVEEFTKTLLILRPNSEKADAKWETIRKALVPILRNSSDFLQNVAIYDKRYQCLMFLDEDLLREVKSGLPLSDASLSQAQQKGKYFTRYNAIKIPFKSVDGHIIVPVTVSGSRGAYELTMMLDTGASMTVISQDLAVKTGEEDLNTAPRRTFSTAKGQLTCAIIERQVRLGDLEQKRSVAVSNQNDISLLGVNFFEGNDYVIDGPSKSIYIWPK